MLLSFDDLHKLFGLAVVFLAAVLGRDEAQVEGIIVLGEVGCHCHLIPQRPVSPFNIHRETR